MSNGLENTSLWARLKGEFSLEKTSIVAHSRTITFPTSIVTPTSNIQQPNDEIAIYSNILYSEIEEEKSFKDINAINKLREKLQASQHAEARKIVGWSFNPLSYIEYFVFLLYNFLSCQVYEQIQNKKAIRFFPFAIPTVDKLTLNITVPFFRAATLLTALLYYPLRAIRILTNLLAAPLLAIPSLLIGSIAQVLLSAGKFLYTLARVLFSTGYSLYNQAEIKEGIMLYKKADWSDFNCHLSTLPDYYHRLLAFSLSGFWPLHPELLQIKQVQSKASPEKFRNKLWLGAFIFLASLLIVLIGSSVIYELIAERPLTRFFYDNFKFFGTIREHAGIALHFIINKGFLSAVNYVMGSELALSFSVLNVIAIISVTYVSFLASCKLFLSIMSKSTAAIEELPSATTKHSAVGWKISDSSPITSSANAAVANPVILSHNDTDTRRVDHARACQSSHFQGTSRSPRI